MEHLAAKADWKIGWLSDPSKRFRFHNAAVTTVSQPSALGMVKELSEDERFGEALLIEGSQTDANNIIQLIGAAGTILEGFPRQGEWPQYGFELKKESKERQERLFEYVFRSTGYFEIFANDLELPAAVAIAAKASKDLRLVYALHKLAESYRTESVTPWSMHPIHEAVFAKHSHEYSDHVRTSLAINLAFSAIEELGLEIRSSHNKRRWKNNVTFEWNPDVLKDINKRLNDAGIDPKRNIDWVIRGNETEVQIHPKRYKYSAHSDGRNVRDLSLSLPDAISACSYLRNFMTAHAFGKKTPLLGPYEVYNVQQVARFLILSKCGLWNTFTDDLRRAVES